MNITQKSAISTQLSYAANTNKIFKTTKKSVELAKQEIPQATPKQLLAAAKQRIKGILPPAKWIERPGVKNPKGFAVLPETPRTIKDGTAGLAIPFGEVKINLDAGNPPILKIKGGKSKPLPTMDIVPIMNTKGDIIAKQKVSNEYSLAPGTFVQRMWNNIKTYKNT